MSNESKHNWISLGGVVGALLALVSAVGYANHLESRISVLESQYTTIIDNQRYMRDRLDQMVD